jgi:hypothetical protein
MAHIPTASMSTTTSMSEDVKVAIGRVNIHDAKVIIPTDFSSTIPKVGDLHLMERFRTESGSLEWRSIGLDKIGWSKSGSIKDEVQVSTEAKVSVQPLAHRSQFEPIILNVGGFKYLTQLSTLVKEEGSLLQAWFIFHRHRPLISRGSCEDGFSVCLDDDGSYFIDRNGPIFSGILDYLRTGALQYTDDLVALECLKVEASYYKLPKLVREISNLVDRIRANEKKDSTDRFIDLERKIAVLNHQVTALARHIQQLNDTGTTGITGTTGNVDSDKLERFRLRECHLGPGYGFGFSTVSSSSFHV